MRLLWVSDNPTLSTGFARVTRDTLRRLSAQRWEIGCAGWRHDVEGNQPLDFPCSLFAGGWDHALSALPGILTEFQPEAVVFLGDLWMIESGCKVAIERGTPCYAHFPIDGVLMTDRWSEFLRDVDAAVAISRFGKDEMERLTPGLQCHVIPHGVDTEAYHPLSASQRAAIRNAAHAGAGPLKIPLSDCFVVGCVARNQPRKQLSILFQAFAQFAQRHPDAALLLHSDPDDVGWDLRALLRSYGIENRTLMTAGFSVPNGLMDVVMNEVYNCMDVFALPTMGEGFGLPILEAMACGIPVVTTDWSAGRGLAEGVGELIRVKATVVSSPNAIEHAIADADHLASLLDKLYQDPDLRSHYSQAGRRRAESMTWGRCASEWATLLEGDRDDRTRSLTSSPDSATERAPTLSVVLCPSKGMTERIWNVWEPGELIRRLRPSDDSIEWVVAQSMSDPGLPHRLRKVLGGEAVLLCLPERASLGDRARAAARVCRASEIWIMSEAETQAGVDESAFSAPEKTVRFLAMPSCAT